MEFSDRWPDNFSKLFGIWGSDFYLPVTLLSMFVAFPHSLPPSPINLEIIASIGCNESFRNCYDPRRQSLHLIRRLLTSAVGSVVSSCTCGFSTLQQPARGAAGPCRDWDALGGWWGSAAGLRVGREARGSLPPFLIAPPPGRFPWCHCLSPGWSQETGRDLRS